MEHVHDGPDLLTVSELARLLKVPVSWVYARSRQRGPDTIPRLYCGRYVRFPRNEVFAWLKAGKGSVLND